MIAALSILRIEFTPLGTVPSSKPPSAQRMRHPSLFLPILISIDWRCSPHGRSNFDWMREAKRENTPPWSLTGPGAVPQRPKGAGGLSPRLNGAKIRTVWDDLLPPEVS